MSSLEIESDSDVEIVDQSSLRSSYHRQQLRLIYDLKKSNKKIPSNWTYYKKFVRQNLNWYPTLEVIRSSWVKLNLAERESSAGYQPLASIELSDDDDNAVPDCNANEVSSYSSSDKKSPNVSVDIRSDSADRVPPTESLLVDSSATSSSPVAESSNGATSRNRKKNVLSKPKRAARGSSSKQNNQEDLETNDCINLSNKKTEEDEAEALREQLLLDTIIRMELPSVIRKVCVQNTKQSKKRKSNRRICKKKI